VIDRITEGKGSGTSPAWHFGGGPEYCRGCREQGLACSRGDAVEVDGQLERCPYIEFEPATIEGQQAWDVLQPLPAASCAMPAWPAWRSASTCRPRCRLGEDLGYDRRALAVLLPMAEAAAIEG
jgi:hypothetical protein